METRKKSMDGHSHSKKILLVGILFVGIGLFWLFQTPELAQDLLFWWPVVIILCGLFFLYQFFFCKGTPRLLLTGLFLFLTGIFILLFHLLAPSFPLSMKQLWPTFMGIVGFSLLCYSTQFKSSIKISLAIPSIFLILFMGISFLFSFSVFNQSLIQLLGSSWPLIFLSFGTILIINALLKIKERKKDPSKEQ